MEFKILDTRTGETVGTFDAESERHALDAMARDAGYRDYDEACAAAAFEQDRFAAQPVLTDED